MAAGAAGLATEQVIRVLLEMARAGMAREADSLAAVLSAPGARKAPQVQSPFLCTQSRSLPSLFRSSVLSLRRTLGSSRFDCVLHGYDICERNTGTERSSPVCSYRTGLTLHGFWHRRWSPLQLQLHRTLRLCRKPSKVQVSS